MEQHREWLGAEHGEALAARVRRETQQRKTRTIRVSLEVREALLADRRPGESNFNPAILRALARQ